MRQQTYQKESSFLHATGARGKHIVHARLRGKTKGKCYERLRSSRQTPISPLSQMQCQLRQRVVLMQAVLKCRHKRQDTTCCVQTALLLVQTRFQMAEVRRGRVRGRANWKHDVIAVSVDIAPPNRERASVHLQRGPGEKLGQKQMLAVAFRHWVLHAQLSMPMACRNSRRARNSLRTPYLLPGRARVGFARLNRRRRLPRIAKRLQI